MAKKKKNSNYITAKTRLAEQNQKKAKARADKIKLTGIIVSATLVFALIVTGVILALGSAYGWFSDNAFAEIEVEGYGTIYVELYDEVAPKTVENFISLASEGFYNGLTFHRIISGFMIQGGDPEGTGDGGSDKTVFGEFSSNGFENNLLHKRGVISMARSNDPDSASSQFFIVHKTASHLDGDYAAFGKVVRGMRVVDKICKDATPYDNNGSIIKSEQPVIKSITIHPAK